MTILIGITGRARAGKDTFAGALTAKGYKRLAFGDAIKQIASIVSGEPERYYHDDHLKESYCPALGMTRRKAMQMIGTELFREQFGPDVWVNCVISKWAAEPHIPTVVTDVRYANEAEAIRSLGGTVIEVRRPDNGGLQGAAGAHSSESGLPPDLIDQTFINDGTVQNLQWQARVFSDLLEQKAYGG